MHNNNVITPTQPSLRGSKIPNGHVVLNSKYYNSLVSKSLTGFGLKLLFDDTLGLIDCYPSNSCAVIIAHEADLVAESELQVKVQKLSKFADKKVILAESTEISDQYFKRLQLKMLGSVVQVIPFTCVQDIGILIHQLGNSESKSYVKPTKSLPVEDSLLSFVLLFPGVGEKKAIELLKTFKSLSAIINAPLNDLAKVVGNSTAETIKTALLEEG
uniref:Fanconi anemia-associated protein of 24 kDa n=1 Tax=Hydra vulgaris TaxID=6087 RepID=T2M5X5_HYDVU